MSSGSDLSPSDILSLLSHSLSGSHNMVARFFPAGLAWSRCSCKNDRNRDLPLSFT